MRVGGRGDERGEGGPGVGSNEGREGEHWKLKDVNARIVLLGTDSGRAKG